MPKAQENVVETPYPIQRAANAANPSSVLLFYNPGKKINEMLSYDHPVRVKDNPRGAQPAYLFIDGPEKGFFEVPTTVTVDAAALGLDEFEVPIPNVYNLIMARWRQMGLVLVEANRHKTRTNDDHVFSTMEEAVKGAEKFRREYQLGLVSEWYQKVEQVRAVGGVPTMATGAYKEALLATAHEDPADRVGNTEKVREDMKTNKELQRQIDELKALLTPQLASA